MIKMFIRYYKPHRKLFIIDLVCALLVSAIDLVFPIFSNVALKNYYNNFKILFICAGILLIVYVIKFILGYIIGYYGHVMGIRLESDMRKDLYKKIQSMDYQYFDNKKTGELMTNLTTHLHDISEMSHHAPEDLLISFIMLVSSFIILLFFKWELTLIVFASLICLIIYSVTRRIYMKRGFSAARTAQGELNAGVENSISGIRLTKAFNNENLEVEKFEKYNELYKKARSKTFRELGLFSTGNDFFINLTNLVLLVFGCVFLSEDFTIIDLSTYFLYINFLIKPISRLTNSIEQIEQGFSGIEKFYKIMIEEPKIVSKKDAIIKDEFAGHIEFKDVTFQYENTEDTHILNHFNLDIKQGEKIALVGKTGVGKSTISKLVPRFYDCCEGEIKIDSINIKEYDLSCLRNAIGHVQQEVYIFYGTIKDNIIYGNVNATMEEIISASKKAHLHDYVVTLPDGYNTLVGEKGVKLSGGQKQRIAIARLFLKNPKILILDEATSSLDNITENQIQEALDELCKGRTTITIAHRLSTIKNSDRIIVLGKEGIVEEGTHSELIKNGKYYSKLYNVTLTI